MLILTNFVIIKTISSVINFIIVTD